MMAPDMAVSIDRRRALALRSIAETLYNAVMPRGVTLEALAEVAEDQWGLFTPRQAESTGKAWVNPARIKNHKNADRVAPRAHTLSSTPTIQHIPIAAAVSVLRLASPC